MKVIVIGAGGETGRIIVSEAVRAGHDVTAFVHEAASFDSGIKVIAGDAADPLSAERAIEGQDAVIDAVGGPKPWRDDALESSVAHAIANAMVKSGVRRLVAISAMGVAADDEPHEPFWWEYILMPTVYRGVMPDKSRMEREFSVTGIDFVIVRPALLSNDDNLPPLRVIEGDEKAHRTSRRDLARFMVDQLTSDEYIGRRIVVAND